MQRNVVRAFFSFLFLVSLFGCRTESDKEYPSISKMIQMDNYAQISALIGSDRIADHKKNNSALYEHNSFSTIIDGLSVDVSMIENSGKLVMLRLKVNTDIKNKELFINDILKKVGSYQTKIRRKGYRVIAAKESNAVISFLYEENSSMVILAAKSN